ncbi:unnamed protein product [Didymodactylos carnosus]|uniref:Putative restriction endonuclease domain-containing protein n=1 Tax=Didymodactylos carnosus TaxID=1234261 RepID=A0A8S2UBR6_9BILA|nr:unnamed protein product [Didymodactylos carnosus]CAF4327212.1 unnamed protein product [Didymodactylos carnosus]
MPSPIHSSGVRKITKLLTSILNDTFLILKEDPITLGSNEPIPDVTIVDNQGYIDHHPNGNNVKLIIEVRNTSLYSDFKNKIRLYAISQIIEVWLVDLQHRLIHIFKQPDQYLEDYAVKSTLGAGNTVLLTNCSNLSIAVDDLFPLL